MEETPELKKAYFAELKKYPVTFKEDNALRQEVDDLALKIAEDPANDNVIITNHEQIKSFLEKKKKKVCWKCRRQKCLSKQTASRKFKLEKKFDNKCDGKPLTFKQFKANNEGKPKAVESTAKITTPSISGSDSDEDTDLIINNIRESRSEEFGDNYYQNVAGFSVEGVITAEDLPNYDVMALTEFVADKSCIICHKDNMMLEDLSEHYHDEHMLDFTDEIMDELELWQDRAEEFANKDDDIPQESGNKASPSDYERFYAEYSQEQSQSGSSSDSSSSRKSSRSSGNKKSK